MKLFISGGSGTLGTELVHQLYDKCERLVVFSRDEQKHVQMRKTFPEGGEKGLRYMIGDIRSTSRLAQAMRGCDYVIHAAAMKHVDIAEYNPQECVLTNVIGSKNVIDACNMADIKKCIMISTDKAVNPENLYGATKLCMEKMAIASNNLGKCRFSVVRYGNVIASKGSVLTKWKEQYEKDKILSITDNRMTRFWISIGDAARFVLHKLEIMQGGEIFIPEIKSKTMLQLAKEYFPDCTTEEIGIRSGEKLHESLINREDARNCYRTNDTPAYYTIYPMLHEWSNKLFLRGTKMSEDFTLESSL
jgi:UDP-N-acetylglucosamine 4,6-dehydratase/5-epimerase